MHKGKRDKFRPIVPLLVNEKGNPDMLGPLQEVQTLTEGKFKSFKLSLGKIPLLILHNKEEGKDFLLLNLRDFRKIIKVRKELAERRHQ